MSTDKLIEKIPDIYFDWYARFIPETIAVSYYFVLGNEEPKVTFGYTFLYALAAYVCGHVIQPASSLVVLGLQRLVRTDEEKYSAAKQKGSSPELIAKVSKAHAKAVGMLSIAGLLIALSLYLENWPTNTSLAVPYFLVAAIER